MLTESIVACAQQINGSSIFWRQQYAKQDGELTSNNSALQRQQCTMMHMHTRNFFFSFFFLDDYMLGKFPFGVVL